jgi:phage terminase large subunit GpA-like protein
MLKNGAWPQINMARTLHIVAQGRTMAKCDHCGNNYDKSFEVRMAGTTNTFDSFECAIHMLAPECEHCGCKIIGHGNEANGRMFCCANCARQAGVSGTVDRVN